MDKELQVVFEIQKRYVWMKMNEGLPDKALQSEINARRYRGAMASLTELPVEIAKLNAAVNTALESMAADYGWDHIWYKMFAGSEAFIFLANAIREETDESWKE